MKKLNLKILIIAGIFLIFGSALGQENKDIKLDYKDAVIVDSDLDGLTDLGEKEIFETDPLVADSDVDGFYDGVEVINNFDPLDSTSPAATKTVTNSSVPIEKETPWAWYINRAAGLMAFILLYGAMFLGLSIRTPILNKIFNPGYSLVAHSWLSLQALFFVILHGGITLFDRYLSLDFLDAFVPFSSEVYTNEIALGIIGLYLMFLLIITSYFKKIMSFKLWRFSHYFNIVLYGVVVTHGLLLGTDLKEGLLRNIFIVMNIFLVVIIVVNIVSRIIKSLKSKNQQL